MPRLYVCKSFRDNASTVYFSKEGDYGWKLDVQDLQGEWDFVNGDHVESTIDEIMPYLMRFVDNDSEWHDLETGEVVSFLRIISSEICGSE